MFEGQLQDRPHLSEEELRSAVKQAISQLPAPWSSVVTLESGPNTIGRGKVDWLVRVRSGEVPQSTKALELNRVLSDIQHEVERVTGAFVTIILNH